MTDDIARVRELEALGEKAYDAMYDTHSQRDAAGCYSDAKDYFLEAIATAHRIGATADATRLEARLNHVRAVFRSQFS
jgi:hypothetical protein